MARAGYDHTPLHDAETSEAIEILLAADADITAQGRNGFTLRIQLAIATECLRPRNS